MQVGTPARRDLIDRVKATLELEIDLKQAEGAFWVEGRVLFLNRAGSKSKIFLHASGNRPVLY